MSGLVEDIILTAVYVRFSGGYNTDSSLCQVFSRGYNFGSIHRNAAAITIYLLVDMNMIMCPYRDPVVCDSSSPPFTDGWRIVQILAANRDTVQEDGT